MNHQLIQIEHGVSGFKVWLMEENDFGENEIVASLQWYGNYITLLNGNDETIGELTQ